MPGNFGWRQELAVRRQSAARVLQRIFRRLVGRVAALPIWSVLSRAIRCFREQGVSPARRCARCGHEPADVGQVRYLLFRDRGYFSPSHGLRRSEHVWGGAGRGPMSQEALTCDWVRPQESAVFQMGEVLIAGIFAQRIHLRHSAHNS
jgi:hypothetical protein